MPSTELLIAFVATTAVFAFIPGPSMLYAAAQTMARGRWSGLMASLGIHLGCYVHVIAAAAGLSVLFHAVPVLYMAVKFAGAAYLVWLGIKLIRAPMEGVNAGEPPPPPRGGFFLQGFVVLLSNPKVLVFFGAFIPQFMDMS
jgi:threonine/homoserine/homoserine lactone efflux protein